jgi:hypothetical protein
MRASLAKAQVGIARALTPNGRFLLTGAPSFIAASCCGGAPAAEALDVR